MITARLLFVFAASSLAAIANAQMQPAAAKGQSAPPGYSSSGSHQLRLESLPGNGIASSNDTAAPGFGLNDSTGAQLNHHQAMRMAEAGPGGHSWSNMPVDSACGTAS